jgi:hypothetical protein
VIPETQTVLNRLIDAADDLEAECAGLSARLPAAAGGQTAALLESAGLRAAEVGRLLRTVAAREGRRAESGAAAK